MKLIFSLFCYLLCLIPMNVFAYRLSCPPVELIKTAKFTHAFNNPDDHDVWNFSSRPFNYKDREWNIAFGTFLRGVQSTTEALKRGQAYFDQQKLPILHPKPFRLPNNIIFCDYVPPGNLFWTAALNPPQYEGRKS